MNISDFKNKLEVIVHNTLYVSSFKNEDDIKIIEDIKKYLSNDSNSVIDDIRVIVSTRNNENYFAYDEYINEFLLCCDIDTKKGILANFSQYGDLIKDDSIYINIWNSLDDNDKINYLETKKKFSTLDTLLINETIKEDTCFNESNVLKNIFVNEKIKKKIDANSINLKCTRNALSLININDYDTCVKLTSDTYTELLLKKCKSFNDFLDIYASNKKIINLISKNSLIFSNDENENIYNFLLENNNFIGKFNKKYLDLFSIVEITNISKIKGLDSETYSTIIERLYKYNPDKANVYFGEDSLIKCSKHSISTYPFHDLSNKVAKHIFDDYALFNRFIDTIMIEAINDNFKEEDIVNILRNDTFIEDLSSYGIELLINKLSFKASFNMLQRKVIFNKINHLNVKITKEDIIFLKGYLDSPVLVYKSDHSMIYEMLNMLNSNEILYYITLPYIINNMSNYEIINLVINNNISVKEILNNKEIRDKFNITDIINLIDKSFLVSVDLSIFDNKELCRDLFNLSLEEIDRINFEEVNYLFENIHMKSLLSKQDSKITTLSYKAVLTSYLVLGLNETLELVNNGNKDITLDEILKLQEAVTQEKILLFKENNSSVFQNMAKKVTGNLLNAPVVDDMTLFADYLKKNTYLDSIVYLMLDNNFGSYNEIVSRLHSFSICLQEDELTTKKDIYKYTRCFIDVYISNKVKEYDKEFEDIILKNFKVLESITYRKRKELGSIFIDKLKYKLFVRSLTDVNKDMYKNYLVDGYDVNTLKEEYIKYLDSKTVDFDGILEHVLIPTMNDRFDKENCLNKLGIKKPEDTDKYIQFMNDKKNIVKLNKTVKRLKDIPLNKEDIITIMEYTLYRKHIDTDLTKKEINRLNKLAFIRDNISIELYIDKDKLKFEHNQLIDIYNVSDILNYIKYIKILDGIISKTDKFINTYMDEEKIKNAYAHDYYKAMDTSNCVFPITNKYYEPIKRVLSIKDLEVIFNGYDLSNRKVFSKSAKDFFFKKHNLIMVVDGYYSNLIDNLGRIISEWDKIEEYLKDNDLKFNNLSLISIENILSLINFEDNLLCRSLSKDIIKSISEDGRYEINALNKRIDLLDELYKNSFKRITSTVPYLCYKDDIYRLEIMDNYNEDILRSLDNSIYKVGALGNDFLNYSILDKNGIQIGLYKDNVLQNKILGVRNGNTLYLSIVEGNKDSNINRLLHLFANELVGITINDKEPIEFVTIVNNDIYTSRNGLKIDETICPIISNPINKSYVDYQEFIDNDTLINKDELITSYEDNISTLLASSIVVDKDNFKYYDAEDKYYRKRNNVIKLSNSVSEEYLNRIETILYLCKQFDNNVNIDNISLSSVNTIFLGDDYCLFVYDDTILKYVLPFDKRAEKEIELIMDSIKRDY